MLRSLNSSFFLFINLFLFCNPRWLMVVTVTAVMWCEVKWSVALAHTHTHLRTHTPSADRLWARCVAWQGVFFLFVTIGGVCVPVVLIYSSVKSDRDILWETENRAGGASHTCTTDRHGQIAAAPIRTLLTTWGDAGSSSPLHESGREKRKTLHSNQANNAHAPR